MRGLRDTGVTIILTTHYIEEAEEMADRIGVINKGEIILVEEKAALMRKLGKKQLTLQLQAAARRRPGGARAPSRSSSRPTAASSIYTFDTHGERTGITRLLHGARARPASASRTCRRSAELARGHLRRAW